MHILLYFWYLEGFSVAQGKNPESYKKGKKFSKFSTKAIPNMFPLNPQTLNLAAVLVLKVANILKVTFTGPTPMYVVVHGTSIQACLEKKGLFEGAEILTVQLL